MRPLARFGVICLIFGIGSAVLNLMNYHFTILMWADGMQPWFGLGLGIVGVGLVLGDNLGKQKPIQPNQFPAEFAPQRGAQQQFEQQQFAAQPAPQQQVQQCPQQQVQQCPQQQLPQQPAQQFPQP